MEHKVEHIEPVLYLSIYTMSHLSFLFSSGSKGLISIFL